MSTNHTPGPWRISRGDVIADTNGGASTRNIARVDTGFPENEANATLIVAAPETLAALRAAVDDLDATYQALKSGTPIVSIGQFRRLATMRDTIAKAEGRANP